MAGIFRIHNKFHRSSHHTLSGTLTQDQGIDPIASQLEPFQGIFYNNLTDQSRSYNILTNSYEWYSTYSTVSSLSSNWDSVKTTYTTVNQFSADWNLGASAYYTLKPLSSNFESTYTTVNSNSANWGDPNLLYTNRVQENTKSKTFKGYDLVVDSGGNVEWNLDIAQVAFLKLTENVTIKNPTIGTQRRGGLYTLYIIQEESGGFFGWDVSFEDSYKFPVGVNPSTSLNRNLSGVTVLNFLSDGSFMFGEFYTLNI